MWVFKKEFIISSWVRAYEKKPRELLSSKSNLKKYIPIKGPHLWVNKAFLGWGMENELTGQYYWSPYELSLYFIFGHILTSGQRVL